MPFRFPSFTQITDRLFGGPLTTNYLVGALVAMGAGAYLTFTPEAEALPLTARALVMMATLLAIARLFDPPLLRWAWLGLMALLSLVPLVDVVSWVLYP